jgi:HSP20 family protein
MRPLLDAIALRAFAIYENNGELLGHDLDDWFQAESELLQPVRVDVTESDASLTVRAAVPGFTAQELEVSVNGSQLVIAGRRDTTAAPHAPYPVATECGGDHIFRVLDLPVAVDATAASALLTDGILELTLPKAASATPILSDGHQAQ